MKKKRRKSENRQMPRQIHYLDIEKASWATNNQKTAKKGVAPIQLASV